MLVSKPVLQILVAVSTLINTIYTDEDITFHNVEIGGDALQTVYIQSNISSARTLSDDSNARSMIRISSISGPLPILRTNSISNLPYLESFILFGNEDLKEIEPGAIRNVPRLTHFQINFASLKEIKEGVFNNLNIVRLDLSDNSIAIIAPRALDNLPKLRSIDLQSNKLSRWDPNWFFGTPKLSVFEFNNNSIVEIRTGDLRNLERKVGARLLLFQNQIRQVAAGAFRGIQEIIELDLWNNRIEEFSDRALEGVARIETLLISKNSVRCLEGILDRIFVAEATDIDDNPFNCECVKKIEAWEKNQIKYGGRRLVFMKNVYNNCSGGNFTTDEDRRKSWV